MQSKYDHFGGGFTPTFGLWTKVLLLLFMWLWLRFPYFFVVTITADVTAIITDVVVNAAVVVVLENIQYCQIANMMLLSQG